MSDKSLASAMTKDMLEILADLVAETIDQFKTVDEYTVEELSKQSEQNVYNATIRLVKLGEKYKNEG